MAQENQKQTYKIQCQSFFLKQQITLIMDRASRQIETHNDDGKLAKKVKNFIYHPSDSIGSGFSSQVFKGINQIETDQSKKNIAIKVIQLSKIQNEVENYLLNNQVNALKLLKHPNILQTIDILMTKNNVYIITEFCEGGDMLKYIKSNGPYSQVKALTLIKDVVQGYKCVQENRIVHRDIKTSNIFLSKGRAKIADFGFCQFVGEKKPQIAYNVGSPAYMSPQSYKQNQYSHKSDIWSIGIVLYQMIVGETPDRTSTYTQMANNLMNGNIKNVQNQQIRKILSLCFKRNLKQRIDSISLCQLITSQLNRLQSQSKSSSNQQPPNFYNSPEGGIKGSGVAPPRAISPTKAKDIKFLKAQVPSASKQQQQQPYIPIPVTNRASQNTIPESNLGQLGQAKKVAVKQAQRTNILKPHTQYLLFLYRLLKFIVEIRIQRISQVVLVLFRHRNMIEGNVQQLYQMTGPQIQQYYKQFQYLKSRLDQLYLQQSKQPNKKNIYKQRLDSLQNLPFTHAQALNFYRKMIRQTCNQCIAIMDNRSQNLINKSQVGIILDYMVIWHELLALHLDGYAIPELVAISKLENIVKEQPKKLSQGHIQLLKFKLNTFINNQKPSQSNLSTQSHPIGSAQKFQQSPPGNHINSINAIKETQQRMKPGVQVVNNFMPSQQISHPNILQVGAPGISYALSQIPINQSITMQK